MLAVRSTDVNWDAISPEALSQMAEEFPGESELQLVRYIA